MKYFPQDEVVDLVAEAMRKHPEAPGFLLDGFPANLSQASLCQEKIGAPVKVIVLEVPDVVMTNRLCLSHIPRPHMINNRSG